MSSSTFSESFDEDTKFLQTSIGTNTHTNDTQTETFITYTCRQLGWFVKCLLSHVIHYKSITRQVLAKLNQTTTKNS